MRLHRDWMAEGRHHTGIIIITRQHYSIGEQLRRLARLCTELSAEDMRDRTEYLVDWG